MDLLKIAGYSKKKKESKQPNMYDVIKVFKISDSTGGKHGKMGGKQNIKKAQVFQSL